MTQSDRSEQKIEKLQLRLIEVEAELKNPHPDDPHGYMTHGHAKLKHERDVIKEKLSFLLKNRLAMQQSKTPAKGKLLQKKQEIAYKKVEAMQKQHPNMTKTAIFSKLSDTITGSTEESIKKSYYAQAGKLARERKAKQKGDSEGKSDQQGQGEKLSPKK